MHSPQQDTYSAIRSNTKGGSEMFQSLNEAENVIRYSREVARLGGIWQWYLIPVIQPAEEAFTRAPSSTLQKRCHPGHRVTLRQTNLSYRPPFVPGQLQSDLKYPAFPH